MSVAGSLLKVTIDGSAYRVVSDADAAKIPNRFENAALPSSGGNMQQKVIRAENITGIDLQVTTAELETLRELADRTDSYPMAITYPDGSTYRTNGFINLGEYNNQNSTVGVDFMPGFNNTWTRFAP